MSRHYKFGLVGHNIGYSRSQDIFTSIFAQKQVDGEFLLYDFPPEVFDEQIRDLLKSGLDGLSVTIPYKNKIIDHLDSIDPVAKALEAVNSIAVRGGETHGYNTDSYGFSLPLVEHAGSLKHGTAVIFGCGGAAKAAVYSLYTDYEVSRFIVLGRLQSRLENFRDSLTYHISKLTMDLCRMDRFEECGLDTYDIVVNCTPLGGWNEPDRSPVPHGFVWKEGKIYYDLNYNRGNVIVDQAAQHGLLSIDGSTMLVGQAVRSWYLWTGHSAEFEPVYGEVFTR